MKSEYFLFEKDPQKRIGWIIFNRPEKLNMFRVGEGDSLKLLLKEIERDDDVKVLIIKGAGECFGSGGDVALAGVETVGFTKGAKAAPPSLKTRLYAERSMMEWMAETRGSYFGLFCKPCIAQVHGYCYGWHFQVCATCDTIIASEDALFTNPAFRYITETWPAQHLMEQMGYKKFAEMVLTGRPFTAREMEQCGFINKVVSQDRLEEEVMDIASVIALQPLEMLMMDKHYLETLRDSRFQASAGLVDCMAHILSTYMKIEPGDFSILRDTTKYGPSGAIRELERRYPPKYRLSYKGRTAKE